MNERLKLPSGNERLLLSPTDGQETLAQATEVFRCIDRNFQHWDCNTVGLPTKEIVMQVYEMVRDSTFQEMFGRFGIPIDSLALTRAQIKQFAKLSPNWLEKSGDGTFFLFKVGAELFVATVYFFSDGRIGVRLIERVSRGSSSPWLISPRSAKSMSARALATPMAGHTLTKKKLRGSANKIPFTTVYVHYAKTVSSHV